MLISLYLKIINKLDYTINYIINSIRIKYFNVEFSSKINNIRGIIRLVNQGQLVIKKNVRINSGKKWNMIGGQTYCSLYIGRNATLILDEGMGISNSSIVCLDKITIGKNVLIGGNCKIYDSDFHSVEYKYRMENHDTRRISKPIHIKDGAFIGAHTLILKGIIIGEKSVIGAGSVVTKDIPDNEIWAGNPIKFIRKI